MKVARILMRSDEHFATCSASESRGDEQFVFVICHATTVVDLRAKEVQHFVGHVLSESKRLKRSSERSLQ